MSEPLKIEAPIEAALIALLLEEDYIADAALDVLPWSNTKEVEEEQLAIVHAHPSEPDVRNKLGQAVTWKVKCDLAAWSAVDAADAGVGLYQFLLGFAAELDLAALNTELAASGVSVSGPYPAASDYSSYGDSFKGRLVSFELSASKTT